MWGREQALSVARRLGGAKVFCLCGEFQGSSLMSLQLLKPVQKTRWLGINIEVFLIFPRGLRGKPGEQGSNKSKREAS